MPRNFLLLASAVPPLIMFSILATIPWTQLGGPRELIWSAQFTALPGFDRVTGTADDSTLISWSTIHGLSAIQVAAIVGALGALAGTVSLTRGRPPKPHPFEVITFGLLVASILTPFTLLALMYSFVPVPATVEPRPHDAPPYFETLRIMSLVSVGAVSSALAVVSTALAQKLITIMGRLWSTPLYRSPD